MKFQKILALVTLILAALTFVYALAFMTSLNPLRFYLAANNTDLNGVNKVPDEYAAAFVDPDAVYNLGLKNTGVLFTIGLIFILVSITLFITASQKRRNYYITNYVSVIATAVMAVVVAILGIVMVSGVMASYSKNVHQDIYYEMNNTYVLNFAFDAPYLQEEGFSGAATIDEKEYQELVKAGSDEYGSKYADCYRKFVNSYGNPTGTFVIGYVLYVVVLAAGVFNALNLLWKIKLMQGEKQLLSNGLSEEKTEEVA